MKTVNSHMYEVEYLKRNKPILSYDESTSFEGWKSNAKVYHIITRNGSVT